jgi:Ser/Thr protein kinase RdoA (MazF antagonist)
MTVYSDTPLTPEIQRAVAAEFGVRGPARAAQRLYGGEESAAYRLGDDVVRVGPDWRADARAEWCHAVAARAAAAAPEFLAPRRRPDGTTVLRVAGRPVSVWRYVPGGWADDRNPAHRRQAAQLLARLHAATIGDPTGGAAAEPDSGQRLPDPPEVADPELDAWLAEFDRRHPRRQPLHGDYYAGNTLVDDAGRIVAVLDWDESYLGPPQREAAHAAWEWGDCLDRGTLVGAYEFLDHYAAAGGPGAGLDNASLRQLIRRRLWSEVRWAYGASARGVPRDPLDQAYTRSQVAAFWSLRP